MPLHHNKRGLMKGKSFIGNILSQVGRVLFGSKEQGVPVAGYPDESVSVRSRFCSVPSIAALFADRSGNLVRFVSVRR